LGVSFIPVDQMARITDKYSEWCDEAGWKPEPDQVVFRGSIYLAETDEQAQDWFRRQTDEGRAPGMALRSSVSQVIQAARAGETVDYGSVFAGSASGDIVGGAPGLTFVGGPDTVFEQIKAYHDQCGAGVIDLFFQQPSLDHRDIMQEIDLFGREVLPRLKEL
jgi:alkanesulfonate monooxygenase SsuD/methylene tetrahydromethanopterin reductase-like flavin-dependent oxidoreductase (luciferase family)